MYAQFLTAKLNVVNLTVQEFDICAYATKAIADADDFLGTSGASAVQEPLARFNEGTAPGCPFHCNE